MIQLDLPLYLIQVEIYFGTSQRDGVSNIVPIEKTKATMSRSRSPNGMSLLLLLTI